MREFNLNGLIKYYSAVCYCLSFPFVEVYHIKRETKSYSDSSLFGKVHQVF